MHGTNFVVKDKTVGYGTKALKRKAKKKINQFTLKIFSFILYKAPYGLLW